MEQPVTQPTTQEQIKSITWEAPEHHHFEKSPEWYVAIAIVALAGVIAAFLIGNILFGVVVILSGVVLAISSMRAPVTIPYAVTARGVRIDDRLYPYTSLESFYIDEDDPKGPQLLLRSEHLFSPLVVLPIPEDEIDDIEDILASRLPEEYLEEPFFTKLLEFFGF